MFLLVNSHLAAFDNSPNGIVIRSFQTVRVRRCRKAASALKGWAERPFVQPLKMSH